MDTPTLMENLFTQLSAWIMGFFGAVGDILSQVMQADNVLLLIFVVLIPLTGLATGYLFRFISRRRR